MRIQSSLKCIIYWLLLVIIMVLHFNYHVGEIFYGIDVARENADGVVPIGTHVIRNIFYHLPIVWITILLTYQSNLIRVGLFIISIVYWTSHLMHLVKDFANPGFSQTPLLILALLISTILTFEHYKYWKNKG